MAASYRDSWQLAQDVGFQHAVQQSLLAACVAIATEALSTAQHFTRQAFSRADHGSDQ